MFKIYKHTFKTSGKSYIGKTSQSIKERLSGHCRRAYNKNSQTHFHRAIRKYGITDIETTLLESSVNDDIINEREIFWITYFDTYKNGYNMTTGGDGGNTRIKMNEEEKKQYYKKISDACKNPIFTDEHKKKISLAKSKNPTKLFGKNNGRALKLLIFDNNDILMFESYGNFKELCEQNNLPYISLNYTRYNNDKIKKGRFKGWYCIHKI